jgi:cell division cycle protein 37
MRCSLPAWLLLRCAQMETAKKRMDILQYELAKLDKEQASRKVKAGGDSDSDDDDDDDDLEERRQALQAELTDLENQNAARMAKIAEYEKNRKLNIDNMFVEKESRTFISPTAGTTTYTSTGYVKPKEELEAAAAQSGSGSAGKSKDGGSTSDTKKPAASTAATKPAATSGASSTVKAKSKQQQTPQSSHVVSPAPPPVELGAMQTYHEFTEKYADTVEMFMKIPDLEGSKDFLIRYADIMLQENASNYLLLASLEDEMNGFREKMKLTARQSQIITSIAELAKTLKTHPGNVIDPFFGRLQQREHLEEFVKGVKDFQEKIIQRAVVKKREMDAARSAEAEEEDDGEGGSRRELADIPREERLGPGGLDPLQVIETLPADMVAAFESRDVEDLKAALAKLPPDEAEYHMKRCIDSGLWVANA